MQAQAVTRIILLAKSPIPGHAKTRLIPELGAKGAANLHKKLIDTCLNNVLQSPHSLVQLHYGDAHPYFWKLRRRYPISLYPQSQGMLGTRILNAFKTETKEKNVCATLLMGSDCPSITPKILQLCIESLKSHNLVFLPAEDGGYGLIGINHKNFATLEPLLQDIPWGSDKVMDCTRNTLIKLGATWDEPATIWDVDRAEDLTRFNLLLNNRSR